MTAPTVKGWCPGASRPMMSADGLVVRVRPRLARLSPQQAAGLCDIALRFGTGQIDLTNRANLQIRSVSEADHGAVLTGLGDLGLLDEDPALEGRRNILVAPFWTEGDLTARQTRALLERLADLPDLPAKVGFAVDCDPAGPLLTQCSADIRLEQGQSGVILRADGAAGGRAVTAEKAMPALIEMAEWLAEHITPEARRMAAVIARASLPEDWCSAPPRPAIAPPAIGTHGMGALVGAPFGQIDARALLLELKGAKGLRVTPWRVVLLEGAGMPTSDAFVTTHDDPLMRVDACPGAPLCASASVETRALARALAGRTEGRLHVSGCAKGCARALAADVTLVGRAGAFDLVQGGRAGDTPAKTGLRPEDLMTGAFCHNMPYTYETDGAEIYRQSFAMIRAEADLERFSPEEEPIVVRMIHAAGLVGLERDVCLSPGFADAARTAVQAGAPILCDARMVSEGVTRARLPADNRVICTLQDDGVRDLAAQMGNTRSAAALELWRPHLDGALVAIGNAPTALFHLLNMLEDPECPRPAAIIGCPVGFVGARESKDALWADQPVPCCIVQGRLGGSAITVAAVNAIASRAE